MLVVGLGTGVNAAPVHPGAQGRVVPPSECGHVNMPVRTEEDFRLAPLHRGAPGRARARSPMPGSRKCSPVAALPTSTPSPPTEAGQPARPDLGRGPGSACRRRCRSPPMPRGSTSISLAQTLADLALIHLPYGGIYLIGGMSRAMTPHFAALRPDRSLPRSRAGSTCCTRISRSPWSKTTTPP